MLKSRDLARYYDHTPRLPGSKPNLTARTEGEVHLSENKLQELIVIVDVVRQEMIERTVGLEYILKQYFGETLTWNQCLKIARFMRQSFEDIDTIIGDTRMGVEIPFQQALEKEDSRAEKPGATYDVGTSEHILTLDVTPQFRLEEIHPRIGVQNYDFSGRRINYNVSAIYHELAHGYHYRLFYWSLFFLKSTFNVRRHTYIMPRWIREGITTNSESGLFRVDHRSNLFINTLLPRVRNISSQFNVGNKALGKIIKNELFNSDDFYCYDDFVQEEWKCDYDFAQITFLAVLGMRMHYDPSVLIQTLAQTNIANGIAGERKTYTDEDIRRMPIRDFVTLVKGCSVADLYLDDFNSLLVDVIKFYHGSDERLQKIFSNHRDLYHGIKKMSDFMAPEGELGQLNIDLIEYLTSKSMADIIKYIISLFEEIQKQCLILGASPIGNMKNYEHPVSVFQRPPIDSTLPEIHTWIN